MTSRASLKAGLLRLPGAPGDEQVSSACSTRCSGFYCSCGAWSGSARSAMGHSGRGGLSPGRAVRRGGALRDVAPACRRNERFGWSDILTVMADQRRREMGWMAFVTLFILWVWFYQFRTVLARDRAAGFASFSDLDGFLNTVFYTPEGWTFLAIGTLRRRVSLGRAVLGDRRRHADAAGPGRPISSSAMLTSLRSVVRRKPGGHARLGGDHRGDHAGVAGAGLSGADLHPADPRPHHMASLSAGRATDRRMMGPRNSTQPPKHPNAGQNGHRDIPLDPSQDRRGHMARLSGGPISAAHDW
jgi:hypothetical protein